MNQPLCHHRAEGAQNGRRFLLAAPHACTPDQLQRRVWCLFLYDHFQLVEEVHDRPYGELYGAALRFLETGALP